MKSLIISQEKRIYWDIFVFLVIIYIAFEIPYSLLVGWSNPGIEKFSDIATTLIFIIDILLNCITKSERSISGFWGWRNFAGIFSYKYSSQRQYEENISRNTRVNSQPEIVLEYLTSGWFLIDIITVIPFQVIADQFEFFRGARTIRLARLPRILRSLRSLRLVKSVRIFSILENIFAHNPASKRFVFILFFVPWLAHIHACFLFFAESFQTSSGITSYQKSLNNIFVTFATSGPEISLSDIGYAISISAVFTGVIFFGALVGNFSSLFDKIDKRTQQFYEITAIVEELFVDFPTVFHSKLQKRIKREIRNESSNINKNTDYSYMLEHLNEESKILIKKEFEKYKRQLLEKDLRVDEIISVLEK